MNREYGHNWGLIWQTIIVLPIVGVFIAWRKGDFSRPEVIILLIVGVYMMGRNALPLCKVFFSSSEIHVSFLIPFIKGGKFPHEEIEHYTELVMQRKGKRIPIAGILQPKNHKGIVIIGAGTKDFRVLNSALLELYPRPEKTEQKVGRVLSDGEPSDKLST
ncbi:MAG: hypothetical protein JJU05_18410 [Verrucomicrobia bacterium]|nr:hypothetical protein [Verrucomicrobiota bacterium]MCH8529099.1 hypothetical protein [Kiritimatiellia bacterium]